MIDSVIHSEISKTRMYSNEIAEKFTMTDFLLLILISVIPNPSNNNYYIIMITITPTITHNVSILLFY